MSFLRIKVGYNEIKKEEILDVPGQHYCGDNAVNAALGNIYSACVEYGFPQKNIDLFLTNIASRNKFNPVKRWILSEPWDGRNRLQTVCDSLVVDSGFPNDFKDTLLRRWLVSAVAAAVFSEEGREFGAEGTLVLHGAQGVGKTTFFKMLAGNNSEWFGNGFSIDPSQKDTVTPAIRRWIVELGEIDSTFRQAELSKLKAFLSNTTDVVRAPYGKRPNDYQRRTVFCGTVNKMSFLMDKTGNRRFWCIPVRRIERLDPAEMQQLWAQVYSEYYLNYLKEPENPLYQWWLTNDERRMLDRQNWAFEVPDGVEDMILNRLNWEMAESLWQYKTCEQILSELGIVNAAGQTNMCMKCAEVIRKRTGQNPMRKSIGRVYRVPDVRPEYVQKKYF